MAPTFSQDSGFDVGSYSFNPYDNLVYGPEGRPTYDPGILDAAYSSSYLDSYLGLRAEDINVDGGKYIDLYSSHAPEELIPGSEFDTMDFRVYTTGGPTDGADFRIFQDMRGLQLAYTITDATTTELLEIDNTNDIIYVVDASALTEPDLDTNQWGALTIGAERIMYRERDTVANTVSGLIRGTAGTAITPHLIGDTVYSMGKNNLFGQQYQNYVVQTNTVADGSTAVFDAPNITLSTSTTAWLIGNTYSRGEIVVTGGSFYRAQTDVPAGTALNATQPSSLYQPVGRPYWQPLATTVEVYVGGLRLTSDLYTITNQAPVSVTLGPVETIEWVITNTYTTGETVDAGVYGFYIAKKYVPANIQITDTNYWQSLSGVEVTILVRRGTWVDY
jgi:hypothetical protein